MFYPTKKNINFSAQNVGHMSMHLKVVDESSAYFLWSNKIVLTAICALFEKKRD